MRTAIAAALLVAACVIVPPAVAGDPPDGGATPKAGELVFRPEAGRKFAFVRRVKFRSDAVVPRKKRFLGEGESVTDLELTFGAPAEGGARPVGVRVLRTTGWWADSDTPRAEFDTEKAEVDPRGRAAVLVRDATTAGFTVRPDGRIVEIEDFLAEQKRVIALPAKDPARADHLAGWPAMGVLGHFAGCWPALPPKRMGAGTFFETESVPPWRTGQFQRLHLRHELKLLDERRAVFETSGGVDDVDPANAAGGSRKKDGLQIRSAKLKSSGFGASAEVDRDTGLVRRSSYRFTIVMAQRFTVDGDEADGTSTTTIESVLERRDAADPPPPPPAPPPGTPATPGTGAPGAPPPDPPSPKSPSDK